jgi:hypothetical protein
MAKRNLADLVGQAVAAKGEPQPTTTLTEDTNYRTSEVTEFVTTDLAEYGTTEVSKSMPRYLQLVRKDTRLREDQLTDLTDLARRLSRRRRVSGERITENTLIRIAVDLLLSQADKLDGNTEDELRRSAGDTKVISTE